jgi:hypothetical protein
VETFPPEPHLSKAGVQFFQFRGKRGGGPGCRNATIVLNYFPHRQQAGRPPMIRRCGLSW